MSGSKEFGKTLVEKTLDAGLMLGAVGVVSGVLIKSLMLFQTGIALFGGSLTGKWVKNLVNKRA